MKAICSVEVLRRNFQWQFSATGHFAETTGKYFSGWKRWEKLSILQLRRMYTGVLEQRQMKPKYAKRSVFSRKPDKHEQRFQSIWQIRGSMKCFLNFIIFVRVCIVSWNQLQNPRETGPSKFKHFTPFSQARNALSGLSNFHAVFYLFYVHQKVEAHTKKSCMPLKVFQGFCFSAQECFGSDV